MNLRRIATSLVAALLAVGALAASVTPAVAPSAAPTGQTQMHPNDTGWGYTKI